MRRCRTVSVSAAAVVLAFLAGNAGAASSHAFRSGMNCYGAWPLPDTGQTVHYSTAPGDDSDYQPASVQKSYTVNADNTVTDNVTGLMWRRCSQGQTDDATCSGAASTYLWADAITACENEAADYSDWRLPNIRELMSIVNYGAVGSGTPYVNTTVFPATVSGLYYTGTTGYIPNTSYARNVNFTNGATGGSVKTTDAIYVRCVRGPVVSTHSFAGCSFPDTDQSISYTATFGEDSDYYSTVSTMSYTIYDGAGWGGTAASSVTVDNRTGLMWVANPNDTVGGEYVSSGTWTWEQSLSRCGNLDYAGFTDWRLPNIHELTSMIYFGSSKHVYLSAFPNTTSVTTTYYWSSTSNSATTAFLITFYNGAISTSTKTNKNYLRCVRGGPL